MADRKRRGFTLIELLVVIGIVVILASIFVPYALRLREDSKRTRCRDNLQQIFKAMQNYAAANGSLLPQGRHDPSAPLVTFSAGQPNSVTAALWLLVQRGYVKDTGIFLCPSAGGRASEVDPSASDFTDRASLGYSYASPYGLTESYRLTDTLKPDFALVADLNPRAPPTVPQSAPLMELAAMNSRNHARAGQNVLYAYGAVEWQITPYCGMNQDNVYTVRGARGATQPTTVPARSEGSLDPAILPSAEDDSFLLP